MWRELRRGLTGRGRAAAWVLVGTVLVVLGVDALILATVPDGPQPILVVMVACLLTIPGLVGAAIPGAASLASEKEARTLVLVLATPLRTAEIIAGKAAGSLRRSLWLWAPLFLHAAFWVTLGRVHVVLVAHLAIIAAGATAFLTGTGLLLSALVRRAPVAVAVNVALGIVLWAIGPIALGFASEALGGQDDLFCLSLCCHPVVQAGVATHGAIEQKPWEPKTAALRYDWPPPLRSQDCLTTTWVFALCMGASAAVGAALAVASGAVLRRRAVV